METQYKLLIVDDEMANLRLLERIFRREYYCLTASSGAQAIEILRQHEVAIIITDQRMPEMTGIELLKHTAELRPHMVRILLTGYTDVEALVEAINCGLVYMYISKPWNNEDLRLRVSRALEHYENNRKRHSLEIANHRLLKRIDEMKGALVRTLAAFLKAKDGFSYDHGLRVSRYAARIAKQMGLPEGISLDVADAGLLHELGKIDDDVLPQFIPAFAAPHLMRRKPNAERGGSFLPIVPELGELGETVRFQGENFDGSGSPRGLIGAEIPLSSRILRVAHEYDLMTHPSDASVGLSHQQALENLRTRAGKECDPNVVEAFIEVVDAHATEKGSPEIQRSATGEG